MNRSVATRRSPSRAASNYPQTQENKKWVKNGLREAFPNLIHPFFVSGTWIGARSDTMNWLFLQCLTGRVVASETCQPSGLTRSSMRKDRFRLLANGGVETLYRLGN